jgi:hypothetical protein
MNKLFSFVFCCLPIRKLIGVSILSLLLITNYSLGQWIPNTQWTGIGTYQFDTSENSIYCAVFGTGILRSTNLGVNWAAISGTQISTSAFNVVHNSNYLFAGVYNNGVYRSSNNGLNWVETNNGLPVQNRQIRALIARGSNLYTGSFTPTYGVYKTTNNGDNWYLTDTSAHISNLYCFANFGQYLFAGGVEGIYRTSNEGVNWVHLNSILDSVGVVCLSVSENKIYASGTRGGGTGGVYVSSDFGNSWTKLLSQITCVSVYNNIIFGAYSTNFYVSTNNGTNWVNRNQGLQNGILTIFVYSEFIFIGSSTGGPPLGPVLWRRPVSEVVKIKSVESTFPDKIELQQNYPNPFNPNTNIRYQIANNIFVVLRVYDILGKEIATLVNEKLSAGTYEVKFDGTNLPSGVYYYKIEAGKYSATKKMLLIK